MSKHEYIKIDGRRYRKFIHFPEEVTDGTLRCIACGQIEALEAKLAAAEKALEPFARLEIPSKPQGNAGAYSILHKDILEARAVLGGKPSC